MSSDCNIVPHPSPDPFSLNYTLSNSLTIPLTYTVLYRREGSLTCMSFVTLHCWSSTPTLACTSSHSPSRNLTTHDMVWREGLWRKVWEYAGCGVEESFVIHSSSAFLLQHKWPPQDYNLVCTTQHFPVQ